MQSASLGQALQLFTALTVNGGFSGLSSSPRVGTSSHVLALIAQITLVARCPFATGLVRLQRNPLPRPPLSFWIWAVREIPRVY
jgi:hypothetical protein